MNNGNITKDKTQILNEAKLFYKRLYEKRNTTNVDLKESLNHANVPILTEEMKNKLEGPLTYTDRGGGGFHMCPCTNFHLVLHG